MMRNLATFPKLAHKALGMCAGLGGPAYNRLLGSASTLYSGLWEMACPGVTDLSRVPASGAARLTAEPLRDELEGWCNGITSADPEGGRVVSGPRAESPELLAKSCRPSSFCAVVILRTS